MIVPATIEEWITKLEAQVEDQAARLEFLETYLSQTQPSFNASKRRDELNRGACRE